MASSLTRSPIDDVPFDILREIFIHCLPQYRLRDRQPDVTIAPMLLCQICSSWRTVALASATLWSHLYYHLGIARRDDNSLEDLRDFWVIPETEYAFFLWWKGNQRSTPPFLRVHLDWKYVQGSKHPEVELGLGRIISFVEYISSASHLDIDSFYWCVLERRARFRYPITYPNPHTLVKSGYEIDDDTSFYDIQCTLPNPILSALRQLSINDDILPRNSIIPNCWSALTHISLADVGIYLVFWFPLIRAVPNLQWANLNIQILWGTERGLPTKCTLPHLSSFFIAVHGIYDESALDFPLSILLTELHLPALQNLSLSSDEELWLDHRAIPELYTILHSTPAITTLTLGRVFLSLESNIYSTVVLPTIRDAEPIWSYAPRLVHLRLEVMDTDGGSLVEVEEARDALIRNILHSDNSWLALDNPASPIQEITIVDKTRSDPRSDSFASFTMSSIQKHAKNGPNVKIIFQLALESENLTAAEAWNDSVRI